MSEIAAWLSGIVLLSVNKVLLVVVAVLSSSLEKDDIQICELALLPLPYESIGTNLMNLIPTGVVSLMPSVL